MQSLIWGLVCAFFLVTQAAGTFSSEENFETQKDYGTYQILSGIRQRCLDREHRHEKKFPSLFVRPQTMEEMLQNEDCQILNDFPYKNRFPPNAMSARLFREIMSYEDEVVSTLLDKLKDIKQRCFFRASHGQNIFPEKGHNSVEDSDANFMSMGRPNSTEEASLYDEIMSLQGQEPSSFNDLRFSVYPLPSDYNPKSDEKFRRLWRRIGNSPDKVKKLVLFTYVFFIICFIFLFFIVRYETKSDTTFTDLYMEF